MLQKEERTFSQKGIWKRNTETWFEFNTGLALIDLQTTGRLIRNLIIFYKLQVWSQMLTKTNFTPKPKEDANVFSTSLCLNVQHIVRQRQFPKKIQTLLQLY